MKAMIHFKAFLGDERGARLLHIKPAFEPAENLGEIRAMAVSEKSVDGVAVSPAEQIVE